MSSTTDIPSAPLAEDLRWCLSLAQASEVRSMVQWMEGEIVLPNGPFAGERYRHHRHPVSRLWFGELDTGRWSRGAATGPTQNGKTLMCYVGPVLYHLFEIGETVIIGLPDMHMAGDKWREDFLPVIRESKYRTLLPTSGEGSRGGQVKSAVSFRNGAALRFMSAGGNDKKRAGYTARVLAVTETDGMDEAGGSSREADKIEQLEGRTRAFGRTGKRIYLECTVSIKAGRIWQEVTGGTDSRIARPCPHCHDYVVPEREHLSGWQDAESEEEAAAGAFFACPSCGQAWSEEDRTAAAAKAVLVHKGQTVSQAGEVSGELPRTQTFGLRWSAVDNPFFSAGDLGAEEWLAARARDRDNAEKKMRQFVWALPWDPPEVEITPLDPAAIESRTSDLKRGIAPDNSAGVGVGVDTGKRELHWEAKAVLPGGGMRVIEYGKVPVKADQMGIRRALLVALKEVRKYFDAGWRTESGRQLPASQVWIDSGYHEHTDAVYAFCAAANQDLGLASGSERYRPTKGYGEKQRWTGRYKSPEKKSKDVIHLGTEYHLARVRRKGRLVPGVVLVHMNSDYWKSVFHERLAMPIDEPVAITLFESASFAEHTNYTRHLVAERQIETFDPRHGLIVTWERVDRDNHWLDAGYAATCAGDFILASGIIPERAAPRARMTLDQMAAQ